MSLDKYKKSILQRYLADSASSVAAVAAAAVATAPENSHQKLQVEAPRGDNEAITREPESPTKQVYIYKKRLRIICILQSQC